MSPVALPFSPERLTRVLAGFIREESDKAGFSRVVVGVSGGIDSALVLLLAVRALPPDRVLAVMMPFRTSAPESLVHAREVVGVAACPSEVLEITPMIDAFREVASCNDALRLGNKMARERMSLLYDRAMRDGALVLGTSNKTELLLGYSTRWGDGAHDLNPIGDLYKCQVRALARYLGCPQSILDKPPSADLVPGQTDEDDLGVTYDIADLVLHYLVDLGGRPARAALALNVPADTVASLVRRVVRTQYKRMPPIICKVQARTIGIDFRFPRDWGV